MYWKVNNMHRIADIVRKNISNKRWWLFFIWERRNFDLSFLSFWRIFFLSFYFFLRWYLQTVYFFDFFAFVFFSFEPTRDDHQRLWALFSLDTFLLLYIWPSTGVFDMYPRDKKIGNSVGVKSGIQTQKSIKITFTEKAITDSSTSFRVPTQ